MPTRSIAAPPTPWSQSLATPQIHQTAYVHSFSHIIGDVRIGANVLVAPGTSIRADEGNPFYIGENTNIQDGVVIHGLEQGRVVGDDQESYSVWIGKNASITHMALIHGPAYIGDGCFIGFRSTVFNARVGQGCIVMMHALIQDVEIPPAKYVPSGAVITTQQQADRLPDVQAQDMKFASHVVGINKALRAGYQCAMDHACMTSLRQNEADSNTSNGTNGNNGSSEVSSRLGSEVVDQVRYLLGQGYKIGTEHVDERRFRTGSWQSCGSIQSTSTNEVVSALEACLNEHSGEYVRLIGIDTQAKRRVLETIIQRPDGVVSQPNISKHSNFSSSSSGGSTTSYSGSSSLSAATIEQVSSLLAQGYKIGMEHVDERRFRTGCWTSCTPIASSNKGEVVAALEACVAEHQGEYVRLIGIDPQAKRRVLEAIIQRPNGAVAPTTTQSFASQSASSYSSNGSNGSGYSNGAAAGGKLNSELVDQIRQLLSQGYKVSAEHVDQRRFRTGSWASCGQIDSNSVNDVLSAVNSYLGEYSGEYVRVVGVDTKAKRRVLETIVQRP